MKNEPIYILVTANNPKDLSPATLTFNTLRVGFPNNPVCVYVNTLCFDTYEALRVLITRLVPSATVLMCNTIHHEWIERLINNHEDPFWILDTDLVFWKEFQFNEAHRNNSMWGEYVPEFTCPITEARTASRIHMALMRINPSSFKKGYQEYIKLVKFAGSFTPVANPVYPVYIPWFPRPIFFDTLSVAYHMGLGAHFAKDQLDCFEHLHCATWIDQIDPPIPGLKEIHQSVYRDINAARGLRALQKEFYAQHAK